MTSSNQINRVYRYPMSLNNLSKFFYHHIQFIKLPPFIMSSDIQSYLSNMEEKIKSYQQKQSQNSVIDKVKDLNTSVLNQIGNQIIESRIIIPDQQKKLKLKTLPPHNELQASKLQQQFNQIRQKKKAILDDLHQLQLMESSIKMSRSMMKHGTMSTHNLKRTKVKSEFTEEDLAAIRQIYKKQKKFKQNIQMGIQKYEEDLEKFKKEKQEQQKEKHRQLCLEKHEQRQKYIQQIEERNKKRQQMLNQQHQKILELKRKHKLFQKLQAKFLEQKQMEAEQIKQKLNEHKKKREFSFDEMKLHQEKYLQKKRIEDELREEKVKNFKDVNEPKFPVLFLDKLKEEKQRLKQQNQERMQMMRANVEKKSAFAEQVRKNLHVKIKTMSESKLSKMTASMVQTAPKWLNNSEKYKEGTRLMREINAKIAKLPRKAVQKQDEQKKPKFKNYLQDLKSLNQSRKTQSRESNLSNFISHMGILQANQDITHNGLAKSIKAKIELMNKLQQMQQVGK